MTEQAGVTTPVTDRPLTAEDVALLREGDLLRCEDRGQIKIHEVRSISSAFGGINVDGGGMYAPYLCTFLGRPGPDGWIEGNDFPDGLCIDVRWKNDRPWLAREDSHTLDRGQIIGWKPHVPASAPSISTEPRGEDLAGKLTAIRDKFLMATPDKDHTDYAIITRCIAALSTPKGEGGASEAVRWLVTVIATGAQDVHEKPLYDSEFNRKRFTCEPLYLAAPPAEADKLLSAYSDWASGKATEYDLGKAVAEFIGSKAALKAVQS